MYDVQALRHQIGYVMQEPVLFNKTIKENILFGKPGASDEEVYLAAQKANCIDFIEGRDKEVDELIPIDIQLEQICGIFDKEHGVKTDILLKGMTNIYDENAKKLGLEVL